MIDRRFLQDIDWFLLGLVLFQSLLGVVFIYSSSHYLPGSYYFKQILWIVLSMIVLFLFLAVDYKSLVTYSFPFYVGLIVILSGMLFFSKIIAGTKSWIKLRYFQMQPSELMKIVLILLLARLYAEHKKKDISAGSALLSAALVGLPFLLVTVQPDLGTAVCYLPLLSGALILAGLKKKGVLWIVIIALVLGVAGWDFYLKDYQKKRLATVVFPGQDPRGSGYHIMQSKIAIGSGGFFGKGFKKGTQSQLKFLPARHTDFVFSVIGEEFGFIGVVLVLGSYFLFLSRLFRSVGKSRDRAGMYIIFMVAMMIAFQFFLNVLMVIGLFPIVGIPLPFISYGGSSFLANSLAISLVLNVIKRRFANV